MHTAVKTRIVRIGNSQGIRIPKPIIEQLGFTGEVELEIFPQIRDGRGLGEIAREITLKIE